MHHMKYGFNPISLKLLCYKSKREEIILDDKVKVDIRWEEDPCEQVLNNPIVWCQTTYLDEKYHP